MSPQNSPDPKQNLKRYLHDFENARKELSEALESDKRIVDLAEKLEARMPELRGRAALETWLLGEETWFTGETWPRSRRVSRPMVAYKLLRNGVIPRQLCTATTVEVFDGGTIQKRL